MKKKSHKECYDCKYERVSAKAVPCRGCYYESSQWQPKPKKEQS